jgi:hypothetical protein
MFRYEMLQGMLGNNLVFVAGEFEPNGASAPNNTLNVSGRGVGQVCGFTVALAATGVFTVTLNEPILELVGLWVCGVNIGNQALGGLEGAQAAGAMPGTGTNTRKQFSIRAKDNTGAAANITQATGRKIQFLLLARTRSQG